MRLTWKRLGTLAAGAAIAACAVAGTGLPTTPHASAAGPGTIRHRPIGFLLFDNTNECGTQDASAISTGNIAIECNYVTTTDINNAPGLDFSLTITPAGTTFNALIGPPLPAGCIPAGFGTNTFTISGCTGGPILAGTVLELGVTGGPAVGNITLTAAYNGGPADPAITVPYQFEIQNPPGPASIVTLGADPGTIQSIVCSNTSAGKVAASPFFVGDTFSCLVTFSAPNSPSQVTVDNVGVPASAPAFTLTGTQTDTAGFTYYTCGNAQTNTPCTTVAITGTFTAPGAGPGPSPIAFDIGAANLGANVFYLLPAVFSPASAPPITGAGPGGALVFVALGVPTSSAIGCVNTNDQTLIQFPTQPGFGGGAVVSTSNQNNTVNGAGVAVTPASLSVIAPTNAGNGFGAFFAAVTCGAVFQDNDADPNLIDGGTITFNLPNPLGFAQGGLGQILESNGNSFTVQCGSAVAFLETCQGANTVIAGSQTICPPPQGPTCVAEPTASNTVHVGLRPNVSFSLIGGFAPVITISATYNRFLSYGPAFSLTTNSFVIGLTAPVYNLSLTPTPNTIPAALGSTTGSVITASLSRVVVAACAPLAAFGAFTICPVPGAVLALGLAVQTLTPGAEPGVVTFQTTSGVFGNPATVNAGSQQVASVHCGAAAGTAPVILTPQVGQLFQFSLTSCTSVSVTLFGGGAAGTAVVTATYVADYTGSTATAATTVTLSATAPTVTLTRGCNEVITGPTVAAAATSAIILALVSPSSAVVSIWQFNNSLHAFQAFYFSTAGAPLDINSVGPNQSLFICVSGTATFTTS